MNFKKKIYKKIKPSNYIKNICLCLFIFLYANSFSQDDNQSGYILLRGKVSSFFILEDVFWRNANIGAEVRLFNKHSVGIDYVFFRWRHENDSTVNGVEFSEGLNAFSKRNYINIDYRYYPFKNLFNEYGIDPYANTFVKFGKRKIWTESDSTYFEDNGSFQISDQKSNYADYGFALGLRKVLGSDDRFGVDVNIGFAKRYSYILYEKGRDFITNTTSEKFNVNESKWVIHMRINLYFQIKKLTK